MGGKSSTSSSQLQIPAPVLAAYNAANASATSAATNPFNTYSGQFVAPLNESQQSGVAGTNAAANEAQPYFGAATGQLANAQQSAQPYNALAGGLAGQGAQSATVSPLTASSIQQYESPYLGQVLSSTDALLNQQNQQAQSGQTGKAIMSGAFGGDRAGIAAANLQQQQDLAEANINSGILNTGYNTALGTAQQQQQTQLQQSGAQEAAAGNIANIGNQVYSQGANTASGLAQLGTGAQGAGLSGAQAQLAAGQVGQTTQQAQDTALYNQFLQQQSYPFQVSQFLANVAEGTGALSGSTTTTTQPGGFFSDERLKEDIEPVGETYDGQKIIRFRYKGDHRKQIGLSAQRVEKAHPDAVGLAGGYRTVDYGKATDDAAERGHFYAGGLVPANDPIFIHRGRHAAGGSPILPGLTPSDYAAIMQAQAQMYAPFSQQGGLYGGQSGNSVRGGSSYVPAANLPVSNLAVSEPASKGATPLQNLEQIAALGKNIQDLSNADWGGKHSSKSTPASTDATPADQARGGVAGYATGGSPDPLAIQGASDAYGAMLPKGVIKGVGGYAAGGMPYSQELPSDFGTPTAVTSLSIPNASPAAKKQQSPPPAAKSPTALQNTEQLAQTANLGNQTYKLGDSAYHGAAGLLSPTAPSAGVAPAAGSAAPTAGTGLAGGTAADTGAASGAGSAATTGAASAGTAAAGDAAATSAAGEAAATAAAEEAASDAAVETAGDVALAFAKRGGAIRKKYDTGGSPTDDDTGGAPSYAVQGGEWLEKKIPEWMHALGQWTDPSGSSSDATPPAPATKPGLAAATAAPSGVAPPVATPARRQRRAAPPVAVAPVDADTTPAPISQAAPVAVTAPPVAADTTSPPRAPVLDSAPGIDPAPPTDAAPPTKSSMWDKVHSVLKGVNDSDLTKTKNLIPLLTGIAAMGTAPTRSLGVALASGLGAGAQSYLPTQQAQQKIKQSQAETGLIGAQAITAGGQPFQQLQQLYAEKGLRLVPDSTGPITDGAGAHYHSEWLQSGVGAPAAPGTAEATPTGYKFVGDAGLSKVPTSVQDYQVANNSPDKGLATASNERMADVYKTGVGAQANQQTLDQFTRSMANLNGPLQAGKLHELALPMVQYFNSAMDEIGQPQLKVGGLDDAQITNKLHAGASLAGQKLSGDRAFGALEVAMSANPNAVMDKGAAMELLAALRAQNQGDIDHMRYYDEFGDAATKHGSPSSKSFLAQDADSAFGAEHSPQQYNVERGALTKFFKSSAFPQYMSALADPNTRESVIQKLDAQGQKFGVKHFSRYFTGS